MIEAWLNFPPSTRRATFAAFLSLPQDLRPTRSAQGEGDIGSPIRNTLGFLEDMAARDVGLIIKNEHCLFDISLTTTQEMTCNCYLDAEPARVQTFLAHMASAQPTFGFACLREEKVHRNQIVVRMDKNVIEAWVGRDPDKYVPGLYWLTLLPAPLADRHHIPLSALQSAAREHVELAGGQHLFRFYDRPEDWRSSPAIDALRGSLPGLFNLETVRPQLEVAKTFLELSSLTRAWS